MKRETLEKLVVFILHHLARVEYVGAENLPDQGPVILVTNHLSQADTPLLWTNPKRRDITALVTDKYKKNWFTRWFTNTAHGIWIDRDRADFAAFKAAFEVLKQGWVLGIAPEGTRSITAQLGQGKPGSILIADRANAPIVPVAICGTEGGVKKMFTFQKPHFILTYGKPFRLPPVDRNNREESMQQLTDEMMVRIAAMLPESYRGYYANHPRLKELLEHKEEVIQPDAQHWFL